MWGDGRQHSVISHCKGSNNPNDQLVAEGNKNALMARRRIINNLDEYLSACQLGITVTALGIGWLGEWRFYS
ncbi:CBS domain containing-hemolysin-like protein [Peribacillus deserti]|uniref:CBS domain containing-hemolysin-like protein n=1 Tax=Peribacillus deserti TaxID=673318 RepID=A0ABS2QKM2_9BACI|nr:CBS domain containing-hemolysin-like protein [Peribacillus deserti]